jgi:NAD(P)H-dependent flavin oxidoreductase YrpB (nitropropane dioxygenase family)
MENYKTILKSKYPVVAMAMNKVSDLPLAIAVAKSGGVPSFSIFNYKNYDLLEKDIIEFKNTCKNDKFFISLGVEEFISQKIIDIIFKCWAAFATDPQG